MHPLWPSSTTLLAVFLSGCATPPNTVVFVTKTSFGVDVEQQTPGVSIAYDRVEGYIAPRYHNEKIPAVYASFNSNGEIYNRDVRHVYATGKAARDIASNQARLARLDTSNKLYNVANFTAPNTAPEQKTVATTPEPKRSMFFGTSTTIGLKLASADLSGDTFVFGVKRKEMSIIPTDGDPDNFPSVIALFTSDLAAKKPDDAKQRKDKNILDIRQFFATGSAADYVANDEVINYQFYLTTKRATPEVKETDPQPNFVDAKALPDAPVQAFNKN